MDFAFFDPSMSDFNPYQVLGVPDGADESEIKTRYHHLAKLWHPDRSSDPAARKFKEKKFEAIKKGYDILMDDGLRYVFDWRISLREKEKKKDPPSSRKVRVTGTKEKQARPNGMLATQGSIQGQQVIAMPDTGAGYNIMTASLAQSLGFAKPPVDLVQGFEIRLAHGKSLRTIGIIEASWSFSSDKRKSWRLQFHIIEDFVYDAVLGNDFLMATETMSKHQYRLTRIPPPMRALSVLYANTLGSVNQRLRGLLNDRVVDTLPDTGSESNLLSLQFIQKRDWAGEIDTQDIRLLLFADGSTQRTLGTLRLNWRFLGRKSLGVVPKQWLQDVSIEFHVLHGCVYDAILGQDILEETDAFSGHQDAFVEAFQDDSDNSWQSELNLVIWLPKFELSLPFRRSKKEASLDSDSKPSSTSNIQINPISTELQRRAAADHYILRMNEGSAKENAIAEEQEIRARYESGRMGEGTPGVSNDPGAPMRSDSSTPTETVSRRVQMPLSGGFTTPRHSRLINLTGMNLGRHEDIPGLSYGASVAPWAPDLRNGEP